MKIALHQATTTPDKAVNLAVAREAVVRAEAAGARCLVLPEMFMALPVSDTPLASQAETLDGHFVGALAQSARAHGIHVVCGVWEPAPDPARVYNTAVVLSPAGETLAAYRKLHLFDALAVRESERMVPGNEAPPVVEMDGVRVGVAVCYDLRFPELFRDLAERGAELVLVPSAWYAGPFKEDHWLTLLRARAIENTCYVAGVNLSGTAFCGRSAVFDPFGVPRAGAGEGVETLHAEIDTERLARVRATLPCLAHRRLDLYPGTD